MAEKAKINLELLKKLVSELDKSLQAADAIPKTDPLDHITELARASGVAGVIMQEAHLLVKDIYALMHLYQGSSPASETDVMSELEKYLGQQFPKRGTN